MTSEEQKSLANFIKGTHALLREDYHIYGASIAWKRHMTRENVLKEYSQKMQKLAMLYWIKNQTAEGEINCRLKWIKCQCENYFLKNGQDKYIAKELNFLKKSDYFELNNDKNSYIFDKEQNIKNLLTYTTNLTKTDLSNKIQLLDVGSCYNPFFNEGMFNVVAIDLVGIPGLVLKCDFLKVKIGKENLVSANMQELLQLQESSYDVINFCLFLEYLPCPQQRYICCEKAYNLLKKNGILFIITPDSKHINANAKLLKSWRYKLSKVGFMRIKYEKLRHLHCLVFRKCIIKDTAIHWGNLNKKLIYNNFSNDEDKIFIPQDLKLHKDKQTRQDKYDANDLMILFNELPFCSC